MKIELSMTPTVEMKNFLFLIWKGINFSHPFRQLFFSFFNVRQTLFYPLGGGGGGSGKKEGKKEEGKPLYGKQLKTLKKESRATRLLAAIIFGNFKFTFLIYH